ncbi:MAG TPA: hypothetical protein VK929_02645 [Longimicrobiales bacterium]|nr:hypothetical protein [Longimicrobiales bacterium]
MGRFRTCVAAAVALAGAPALLHAQDGFLFSRPEAQLTVRAGPSLPQARSDLFDEITTELTLERSDFRAPMLGAELALLLGTNFDLALGVGWAESSSRSEYRDFEGDDGLPIEQRTRLRIAPVTATARYLPLDRGRTMSNLAWLPARVTPYIGGGVGMTWYRLRQEGEFVDRQTYDIFLEEYESTAHNFTVHAVAGGDWWVTPRIGLNVEARHTRGSAPVQGSYSRFESMDLSGTQAFIGVSWRW